MFRHKWGNRSFRTLYSGAHRQVENCIWYPRFLALTEGWSPRRTLGLKTTARIWDRWSHFWQQRTPHFCRRSITWSHTLPVVALRPTYFARFAPRGKSSDKYTSRRNCYSLFRLCHSSTSSSTCQTSVGGDRMVVVAIELCHLVLLWTRHKHPKIIEWH